MGTITSTGASVPTATAYEASRETPQVFSGYGKTAVDAAEATLKTLKENVDKPLVLNLHVHFAGEDEDFGYEATAFVLSETERA